jgi:hypothetical protein
MGQQKSKCRQKRRALSAESRPFGMDKIELISNEFQMVANVLDHAA